MKTLLFTTTIMLSALLCGCNSNTKQTEPKESPKPIANHKIINNDEMTIIENADCDMEWEMISRSKIKIEDHKLDYTLKLLAGESPSRIIIEGELDFPVMSIIYEPADIWESSISNNKKVVLDSLQKYYTFKINKEERNMKVTDVVKFDNNLLIARKDKNIGTTFSQSGKIARYKNYTLEKLFSAIEQEFDIIIEMEFEDKGKYDIELNLSSWENVTENLTSEYGFTFNDKEKNIEVTVVSF